MSTQYSNIFSHRSFSLFTPFSSPLKAYPTHPFRNKRRSRNRTLSSTPPPASQSSSDIVLIATTEHRDGSLVFRFGDASEVVENDDVLEEIESKAQQESSIVKVLDGDQEREVIIKRIERGYGRDVTEVAHGIGNADTASGSDERETKFTSDSHAESSDVLSDIYEEEVLSSQSDAKLNNSLEVVVDETDSTAQVEGDGNLNPTISLRDNSPNRNNDADPKGTLLKDNDDDDETEDSSISVMLESTQVSKDDVMDVKQPYDENELDKVKIEDTDRQGLMPISDVELTYAANDYMEEGLNIDEMSPPSDILGVEPTLDEVEVTMEEVSSIEAMILTDQAMEDELQEVSTYNREGSHVSHKEEAELTVKEEEVSQIQSAPLELKPTMQISYIELEDTTGQYPDDGILQVKEESDDLSVSVNPETIKVSDIELQDTLCPNLDDIILQVTEKSEDPSVENFQVSDIELQDTVGQNTDDGFLQVKDQSEDPLVSVELETMQVSNIEVMDVTQAYAEDELDKVETEDTKDLLPPATIHNISDVELEDTTGQYPDDGILQVKEERDELSVSVNPETIKVSDIELQDTLCPNLDDIILQVTEKSEEPSVEIFQVSDIELQDTVGQNTDDGFLQVKDQSEDPLVSVELETMQVSNIEVMDVTQAYAEDELDKVETEDTKDLLPPATIHNISDVELEDTTGQYPDDGILQVKEESDYLSVSVNPKTIKVSDIELQDTLCPNLDDIILQVTEKSEDPSVENFQVSDIELQDTVGQNTDDGFLQVKDQSEDPLVSVELETMQVSNIEVMDVTQAYAEDELDKVETEDTKDLLPPATIHNISDVELTDAANEDMEERLQDMAISEATFIDGMMQSLGAEPTINEVIQLQSSHVEREEAMEVSTDLSVDAELQQVSIDSLDKIDVADVMIIPEQISDFEVEDVTCQNLDDGILQVINEDAGDSLTMDVEQSSNKLEDQPVQDDGVNHNMMEQCAETDAPESSILLKQDAHDLILEAEQNKENVSGSELAEASEDTALLLAAEAKVKREEIYLTGEFLSSGAALLEHPFKALTGGDNAYFVAGGKWLGVANGVSQWSFEGTDPGVYAQELMRTCEDIVLDTTSVPVTNPVELLCRGVKETNMSGSASVLIASFDGQFLHVANIGDTGFLIIRHGAIYKKSSPLLHEFHFALQVEDCDDPLQLVEECRIELDEGDIVVSATDGLFDNLYEREIAMIVSKSLQAELEPQEIANVLATKAQVVGKSAFVRSPFSDAAQAAGYTGCSGGKPDSVAVIVSLVEKISNLLGE